MEPRERQYDAGRAVRRWESHSHFLTKSEMLISFKILNQKQGLSGVTIDRLMTRNFGQAEEARNFLLQTAVTH
jgi:hypothetical protein